MTIDCTNMTTEEFHEKARQEAEKEYTPEEAKIIKDKLVMLNEKFMEGELITPDKIYVDLPLLKDINLGVLFSLISRRKDPQKDFDYIKKNLKDYQIRIYDNPLKYFPELNISQEEFDCFKNDPKKHDEIYILSPFTIFQYVLKDNLKKNAQYSTMKKKYKDRPIPGRSGEFIRDYDDVTYFINTYPLEISDHNKKNLQVLISDHLGVNTIVFYQNVKSVSSKFFHKMDEINSYSPNLFLSNDSVRELLGKEEFLGKHIFMPLMFSKEKESLFENKDEEFAREKQIFHATMALCSHFQWLESARYCVDISLFENEESSSKDENGQEELPVL